MATTAADYLREALKALISDLEDLNRQIGVIRRTLNELEPGEAVPDLPPPTKTGGRPIRDIALELAAEREVFSLQELVDRAKAEGNDSQYASVSSMLSRLAKEGYLTKGPRRGTYRAISTMDEEQVVDEDEDLGSVLAWDADLETSTQPDPESNPGVQSG